MGCPPVRKIIHSLKLVDYLHVQADNPWYNYYKAIFIKIVPTNIIIMYALILSYVHKIMHSLKLVDYLHVQADIPWYNYYIAIFIKIVSTNIFIMCSVNTCRAIEPLSCQYILKVLSAFYVCSIYSKTCLKRPLKKNTKIGF